jgi:hypothetical protein
MTKLKFIFTAIGLFWLYACSSSQPPPDDKQFLDQLGFNQPLSVAFQIGQVYDQSGRIVASADARVAAVMSTAGYLTVSP